MHHHHIPAGTFNKGHGKGREAPQDTHNIILYSDTFLCAAFALLLFSRSCIRGELLSAGLATVSTSVSLVSLPVNSVTASFAIFPVSFPKSPASFLINDRCDTLIGLEMGPADIKGNYTTLAAPLAKWC